MFPVAVLAGGLATRLKPLTGAVPKVLVDVAGRPFAEHQLEWLARQGVDRVVYCLGHLGQQVVDFLGDGSRWGMRFTFVFDGTELLGTGGALRHALPFLGECFFVLYGDSLLACDLREVERSYVTSRKACLMTVFRNDGRWDRSNIVFENGAIVAYDKKTQLPNMHFIDYGLGVVRADVLAGYSDGPLDLADVYRDQLAAGELSGHEVTERFYEIGSPAGLEETRAHLTRITNNR